MKHLKITLFSFILLFVSAGILFSCSSESENIQEQSIDQKTDSFLKKFYSNDYQLGKTKTSAKNLNGYQQRTTQIEDYSITEVFVGNEDKARGYLFENLQTNEIESFVDVDRTNYKLTSVDLNNYQVEVQNAINQMPEYLLTDEFDLINIIRLPIPEPNPTNPQPVTYGWHYEWGACGNGVRGLYKAYYLFGIKLTKLTRAEDENGNQIKEPC